MTLIPLITVFIANRDKYFSEPRETVKLGIGAIMIIAFAVIKVLGKVKIPSRLVGFAIVFALAYLFKAILSDLFLISGMALLGEFLDAVLFAGAIKRTRENILVEKTADSTTSQVEELFKKYVGSGRT